LSNQPTNNNEGNVQIFTGQTGSTLTLNVTTGPNAGTARAPLNGLQIVDTSGPDVRVPNFSFEHAPDLEGNSGGEQFSSGTLNGGNPGWTTTVTSGGSSNNGVQNPASGFYGSANPLPDAFHGNQIGFVNLDGVGASANVDSLLIDTLMADHLYTLNAAVGVRSGSTLPITYDIGLVTAGGTELGTFASQTVTAGQIIDLNYVLNTTLMPAALLGQSFHVRIRGTTVTGSSQMNFDNVRLSVFSIPEPSALTLTALGLLSLGFVSWRRRHR
jgi:hypothetical protein